MRKAALVLAASAAFLFSVADATAATRKTIPSSSMGTKQGAVNNTASPGFTTPYGEVAFFGPEFVSEHSAGSRFNYGDNPSSHLPNWKQQLIKLKPMVKADKGKIAAKAVSMLKSGPGAAAAVAGTAALTWAIEQIPGASFDPQTGLPVNAPSAIIPSATYWNFQSTNGNTVQTRYSSALQACSSNVLSHQTNDYKAEGGTCWVRTKPSICPSCSFYVIGYMFSSSVSCPTTGVNLSTLTCNGSAPLPTPFTDSDYANLESTIRDVQNTEWHRDLIRASCNGSLAPAACYDELTEWGNISGPATQQGQPYSTTTTKTNPDGTTSTTTTTTKNTYNYTYGPNFFDFSTTTTTTTNTDGQVTEETTTEEPPEEGEEPQEDEPALDLGDPWAPVYDQYADIESQVSASPNIQPLPTYSPWYSFGGSCHPLNLNIPVLGAYTIDYCPYVEDYVRPVLGFLFAVFTFSHIFGIWRETTTQVRPL